MGTPPNLKLVEEILKPKRLHNSKAYRASRRFLYSKPRILGDLFFKDPEYAYHILNLSLAIHSYATIESISEEGASNIIVQGGFANNMIYLMILSALLLDKKVFRSGFSETTELGAALCVKCATEDLKPKDIEFDTPLEEVSKPEIDQDKLDQYVEEFMNIVTSTQSES